LTQSLQSVGEISQSVALLQGLNRENNSSKILQSIFKMRFALRELMAPHDPVAEDESEIIHLLDQITELECVMSDIAAKVSAQSLNDVILKLGNWMLELEDSEYGVNNLERADALTYSAFCDLVKLAGECDAVLLLKDHGVQCEPLQQSLS